MARVPAPAPGDPTSLPSLTSYAAGVAAGLALDAAIGDPRRGHPVAAFGVAAGNVERLLWRDSRTAGLAYTAVCVGVPVTAVSWTGGLLRRASLGLPGSRRVSSTWGV